MTRLKALAISLLLASSALPGAARAEDADALMDQFFAIWSNNAKVTPQEVRALYGTHVLYYGRAMTTDEVYADKRALIRRWPSRRYDAVPGTVVKSCDATKSRCSVSVTLAYSAASGARGATTRGQTRINLALAREGGTLKIVRENGSRVRRPVPEQM